MKSLLWKEFRERRVMAILWTIVLLATALIWQGQAIFSMHPRLLTSWYIPLFLLAVIIGAGAYRSELTDDRALFLFSRPVTWRSVLLAKVLYGLLIIFAALAAAAVLFYLINAVRYRAFIAIPNMLDGIWWLGWKVAALYLFGLACSAVLPGVVGGLLTIVGAGIVTAAVLARPAEMLAGYRYPVLSAEYNLSLQAQVAILVIGTWLAALPAGWLVIRAGVHQGTAHRLKRFALAYVVLLLLVWWVGGQVHPHRIIAYFYTERPRLASVSPHGRHAVITIEVMPRFVELPWNQPADNDTSAYLIRLDDRSVVMTLPRDNGWKWWWATDEIGYYQDKQDTVHLVNIITGERKTIPSFRKGSDLYWRPSPDGKYLYTGYYTETIIGERSQQADSPFGPFTQTIYDKKRQYYVACINTATGARFGPMPIASTKAGYPSYWWHDSDTLGYLDENERRQVLPVRSEMGE